MAMTEVKHTEEEFIFDKKMTCAVCETPFTTKVLKSSKARRVGSDPDMRPRFKDIDILKYGVCSCPNCGYSAIHSAFPHVSKHQMESVVQQVSSSFQPEDRSGWTSYTYDQAIRMHELALTCAEAKKAKDGEKSYLHLLLSWLYREKQVQEGVDCSKQADEHYRLAYDGFQQALMNELFPIAGMDQPTVEYLIAYMAYHFGDLEVAAKMNSSVLTNSMASHTMKDRALDLKDELVKAIKEKKK
jgi:uncharacterized protein (DUF2225 family)